MAWTRAEANGSWVVVVVVVGTQRAGCLLQMPDGQLPRCCLMRCRSTWGAAPRTRPLPLSYIHRI